MSTITEVYKPAEKSFLIALDKDRRDGHKYLMSCLEDPRLSENSPRRDAGLLWDIDQKNEQIIIQRSSSTPFNPTGGKLALSVALSTDLKNLEEQKFVALQGKIARQYSPLIKVDPEVEEFFRSRGLPVPKRPRSRLQPVPPEKLHMWVTEKLERLGLNVHEMNAEIIPDIRLSKTRKRESVPAASFTARISGSPENVQGLLENGLGRAKNYGLGLIQIQQDS